MTSQDTHRQIAEVILHNVRFGGVRAVEEAENKISNIGVVIKFAPELSNAEVLEVARELSSLATQALEEWEE